MDQSNLVYMPYDIVSPPPNPTSQLKKQLFKKQLRDK